MRLTNQQTETTKIWYNFSDQVSQQIIFKHLTSLVLTNTCTYFGKGVWSHTLPYSPRSQGYTFTLHSMFVHVHLFVCIRNTFQF